MINPLNMFADQYQYQYRQGYISYAEYVLYIETYIEATELELTTCTFHFSDFNLRALTSLLLKQTADRAAVLRDHEYKMVMGNDTV